MDLNDDEHQHPNTVAALPRQAAVPEPALRGRRPRLRRRLADARGRAGPVALHLEREPHRPAHAGDMCYSDGMQYSLSRHPDGDRRRPARGAACPRDNYPTSASSSSPGRRERLRPGAARRQRALVGPRRDRQPVNGLFDMNRDRHGDVVRRAGLLESELYYDDRDADGFLSDDERDEDADGLTNYVEYHGPLTAAYWSGCYSMEKPCAHRLRPDQPRRRGHRRRRRPSTAPTTRITTTSRTSWRSAGSRPRTWTTRTRPRLQAPEPAAAADGRLASPTQRHYGRVQPFNPCLPFRSRTCPRFVKTGPGAPFDLSVNWFALH